MAALFGAGFAKDAFEMAFRIPNLMRDFFAENALSASFVPVFVEKMGEKNRRDMWNLANNLFNTLLIIVGVLVVVGIALAPEFVPLLGHGFKSVSGKLELTILLNRILFPFLIFISLSAWAAGILNAHNRFFLPALSSALFNLGSVALAFFTYNFWVSKGLEPIIGMAFGGVVGVFLQFILNFIAVRATGYRYRPYVNWKSPDLWKVLKLWGPVVLGLALIEIQVAVDIFLAALLEQGSISWLNYAYRVMHLPLALFGAAIGTVSLTLFSKLKTQGKLEELALSIKRSLRSISILLIPTLLFFIAFANPIIRVIYQRGEFSVMDTAYTAQALIFYVAGIWAASSIRTLAGAFYAYRNSVTPMLVNLSSVVLNISLNLLLAFLVFKQRQFRAFAIATTACSFFSMSVLMILLARRIRQWNGWDHIIYGIRTTVAAGLALAPVYGLYRFYLFDKLKHLSMNVRIFGASYTLSGDAFLPTILMLTAGFFLFAGFYFVTARIFGLKEFAQIIRRERKQ